MMDKLHLIRPEIALFITTCVVMIVGLSKHAGERKAGAWLSGAGLIIAGALAWFTPTRDAPTGLMPMIAPFMKTAIAAVGFLMLLTLTGTVDRRYEARVAAGERFDPIRATRGEFYAFFLFSLTGVMLCAGADDLIWLFLALELTSLPTYVMVAISSGRNRAQEAGVKYFFLGAFGAALFLYGFALLYGATGTTMLPGIAESFASGKAGVMGLAGMTLALVGVGFKIAAVPMHFYTADVYEGAATPVSAYLAFAPKTAGFLAAMSLVMCAGWGHAVGDAGAAAAVVPGAGSLPESLRVSLFVIAALSMTVGNVLAILQTSVKRMLAYSSIAHSGYMLVGVIAGPGEAGSSIWRNGLSATVFYLVAYGAMNLGAFAALSCVERQGKDGEHEELETLEDIRGLCAARPLIGWSFVLCTLSLLGFPPLLGFWGKLFLLTSAISAGEVALAVILALNSAIAAYYYLRLVSAAVFDEPGSRLLRGSSVTPARGRLWAIATSAALTIILAPVAIPIARAAAEAVSSAAPRTTEPVVPATAAVEAPPSAPSIAQQ